MRRNLLVGTIVGGMVAAAGLGWVLGSQIRSPAELAAAAAAPSPSNITVEVVRQVLSADVVTRGDVVYDEPVQLHLSGSLADQPERLVVTAAGQVDATLSEGDTAVEVVGRPVFLLEGEIPVFRDLRPGASGVDVHQLEAALARLGYFDDGPDEVFDAATGAALAAWYQDRGYVPNGPSAEDAAELRAARERVRDAERAVADLEGEGAEGTGRSARLAVRAEVDAAVAALELARLDAERARTHAARAVEDATADRAEAASRLRRAERGRHPDTGERPTSAELAQLRRELREADAALSDARFEVERSATEQAALVSQARDQVAVARAAESELEEGGGADGHLAGAREELAAAREELAELEATIGTWLPAGEVVVLPRLPVRVDQVFAERGSEIDGAFLTVSGSDLAVRTSVPERDAPLLSEGMEVEIEDPEGGPPLPGTITRVADRAGTHDLASDRVYVEVSPDELPSELIGQNVRITIPVSSTAGAVLAVPAAALSATAAGATVLQVAEPTGSLRTVVVETGLATGGLVEVTPRDGRLEEGDLVVVGRDDGSPLEVDEDDPATEPDADTDPDADTGPDADKEPAAS